MSIEFLHPPVLKNQDGRERAIGVEFEFTGLPLPDVAGLICDLYGGETEKISAFKYRIKNTTVGPFTLELDFMLLREKKYETILKRVGIDLSDIKKREAMEDKLNELASTVVPFEIITAPVPFSRLYMLEYLVEHMREYKAEGTGASWKHAFGLHLNPEAPRLTASSITSYLKAFLLLEPWIRQDAGINLTRRVTPYIDEFEDRYRHLVLSEDYWPDMEMIIVDYATFNPTRNRPLDLLPLFKHLNRELVDELISNNRTTARPAYHYRLPNCKIDEPNWSIAEEWNRWILIERLASDPESISRLCRDYRRIKREKLLRFDHNWILHIHKWVYNVIT